MRPPPAKRLVSGSLRNGEGDPIPLTPSATVDELPELLAGLEVRDLLRRHHHAGPRLGVPAGTAVAPADAEAPEAPQLDLVALLQGVDDGGEDGFHDDLGVLASEVGHLRHLIHQLGLGHSLTPPPPSPSPRRPGTRRPGWSCARGSSSPGRTPGPFGSRPASRP